MSQRRVSLKQLFLQPRVHRVWMLKHESLRFDVSRPLAERFSVLWQRYCEAHKPSPAQFLTGEALVEDDAQFALFASAVYLDRTLPGFQSHSTETGIYWHFDSETL